VPDLLEQDALGVVGRITCVGEVVLVHDGVRGLDDVEGIEGDAALPPERIEVLRALRKRSRDRNLIVKVNTNVRMSRTIGRNVLEHARGIHAGYRWCTRKQIVIVIPEGIHNNV
jgi:hypothetical protein